MIEAEARRIWARGWDVDNFTDKVIAHNDLPLLERAFTFGAKNFTIQLPDKSPVRITDNTQLFDLLKEFKLNQRDFLLQDIRNGKSSVEQVARTLNMKTSFLEQEINQLDPVSDIIADRFLTDKQLLQPRYLKLGYKPDAQLPSPAELDGMTWLTQLGKLKEQELDRVFANYVDAYIKTGSSDLFQDRIKDGEILGLTRYDGGAGFLSASSANYGSAGARAN